ncbi:hypothetical protein [Lihuaxuella thermophila]|uniref:Protein kinase domain-containing protein n=1 Tax=Lihuaxuella thermophila TaxID=1173111 RepID=A0A1H8IF91_9BACL|nr:hypothetical protein [Lihuaxuella thermophila]SEN66892.1 hypothetical protein SAMN05444955_11751 [Lihuaxuella thermophila]
MAFFHVGERYRDSYYIEHAVPFFDGELAIAQSDSQRYYLQSAHLQKQAPARAIQQYRSLNHPLVIPFLEVYTEERSLVFIRPYVSIQPLSEAISTGQVDEDQVVEWGKQLLQLASQLQSMPIPMYLLLDPRNIGLTDDGDLKVFFCGLQRITSQKLTLDWGTFFYCLLSGQYLEEPIDKVPEDLPVSKHMIRLIQKSLKNSSVDSVRSQIDAYEKRKHGKSLFSRLFGGEKKEEPRPQSSSSGQKVIPPVQRSESPSDRIQAAQPTVSKEETPNELEQQHLEQIRLEYERRQQELLEQLRRQQEELERLERERREKERLEKELQRAREERERLERERREQEERERLERERREQEERERLERERREQEERERLERERREQEERERLERERREREERERLERERREQEERERLERERREREERERALQELERLKRERMEWERKERERLEKERQEFERKERELRKKLQEDLKQLELQNSDQDRNRGRSAGPDDPQPERVDSKSIERQRQELERVQKEKEERERLLRERIYRESEEHAQLARQFEEYMKQMLNKKKI